MRLEKTLLGGSRIHVEPDQQMKTTQYLCADIHQFIQLHCCIAELITIRCLLNLAYHVVQQRIHSIKDLLFASLNTSEN